MHVVNYHSNAGLWHMEQIPLQDESRVEEDLQRKVLPCVPDAWAVPEILATSYETNLNQCFHRFEPMQASERKPEGLLGEIIDGQQPLWLCGLGAVENG